VNDVAGIARSLTDGLRAAGHDARFVDIPKFGARLPYPAKLAAIPPRLIALAALAARLRREKPDVVHIHYASQAVLGPLTGAPYVVHCHGTDIRGATPTTRWGRVVEPWVRHATGVLYSTPDLAPWARSFRGDAQFLPSPIDTVAFRPGNRGPVADVLISTRLDAIKGADVIIETARTLLRVRPETTFTVVDHGARSRDLLATLGDVARVIPPQPRGRMPELLRSHAVFLGQFQLGIGQAELEALASGVPVVARLRDIDPSEEPPPVAHAVDASEAAAAVVGLLEDPVQRATVAAAGRAWVARYRDLPVVVRTLLQQYAEFGIAA
jgi:glycosyltransferase involved in cell wall biosynthesis